MSKDLRAALAGIVMATHPGFLSTERVNGPCLCAAHEDARAALAAVPAHTPGALDVAERKSLEAMVNYWVGRGDAAGALSHEEGWAIARAVVDGLTNGEIRHTSSIPKPGFHVEVRVVRAPSQPSAPERECLCESEFIWACSSECRCFHHDPAYEAASPSEETR